MSHSIEKHNLIVSAGLFIAILSCALLAGQIESADDSAVTNLFRDKLDKVAPKAKILSFGEAKTDRVTIEGRKSRAPNPESWAKVDRLSPANIWSPDSLAYARFGFGDPPENVFISSLVDSVHYYTCFYMSHAILLDAFWIDVHKFVLLYISLLHQDRPPSLHAYLLDLRTRQKTTWTISFSGTLPKDHIIKDAVMKYEHLMRE